MDHYKKIILKDWPFLLGLVITLSLLWPLAVAPIFTHHDDIHVIRLYEMNKCFEDFQIPCRWTPDLGGGYGWPLFNYYGPLPYYFGEIVYVVSHSLTFAVKFMFATAFVGSYVFMYLLAKKLWGKTGGTVSGIFYSLAPYHSVVFYVRGAMAELWGLMFLPALFWAILNLAAERTIKNYLILSLVTAFLITSHNLSAMIYMPLGVLFGVGLIFKRSAFKNFNIKKYMFVFISSLILGLMVSAFYFIPMITEKNLVHVESTTYGYFSYTEHFKGLKKLFIERNWGWGASVREVPGGERDGMSFQIGWIHLLAWVLVLIGVLKRRKSQPEIFNIVLGLSAVVLFFVFMIHPRSEFVWKLIEPLKYLQFPWRFLGVIIFSISLIAGGIVFNLKGRKFLAVMISSIILVTFFNFGYFRPEKFLYLSDAQLLSGEQYNKQIMRSILDFLPMSAIEPPADPAPGPYQILTPNKNDVKVKNLTKRSENMSFDLSTNDHTIVRLSIYYFPDWKIWVNDVLVKPDIKNHLGLMTLIVGQGDYHVQVKFRNTPVRSISNILTIVGLLIVVFIILFRIPRLKKYTHYYAKSLN